MTDDMVERVARAIAKQNHGSTWDEWIDEARAAIVAMREPTDTMVDGRRITRECNSAAALWAPHIWRSMIDAALCKENPDAKT